MKKPLIQEYKDKIAMGYEITGVPRVRAEWNWNQTSKLSQSYRTGAIAHLYVHQTTDDSGTLLTKTNVDNGSFIMTKAALDKVFATPIVRTITMPSPSFTDLGTNPTKFTYASPDNTEVPVTDYFGLEIFFQFEATEDGVYQFYGTSDDSYEVYITDDDGDETELFHYYGIRGTQPFGSYDETAMSPTLVKGNKYKFRVRWYDGYFSYGLLMYFRTPSMIAASNPSRIFLDGQYSILPGENGPKQNPETAVLDQTADVIEWSQYKEFFPIESILANKRPVAGIRYNILGTGVANDAFVMRPDQYITTHNEEYLNYAVPSNPVPWPVRGEWTNGTAYIVGDIVKFIDRDYKCLTAHTAGALFDYGKFKLISQKPKRYYNLHRYDQKYKYWISDTKSSATPNGLGYYNIADTDFIVYYDELVSSNKVSVTFNLGALPKEISIDFWGRHDGEAVDAWHTIFGAGDIAQVNPYTGEFQFWYDGVDWQQHPTDNKDNSVHLKKLRVQVQSINKASSRLEVIEASARKELDVTERVASFDMERSMDESDFMRLIGKISANSGTITLSDWDNAFELDEGPDAQKLEQVKSRQTKFTFDIVYDLDGTNYTPRYYPVRIATLHSADWSRDGEYDFTVNLFDSAKLLQNTDSTEFFEKGGFIHTIIAQLLDSVGFDAYQFDRYDWDSILNSTRLDYFSPGPDDTVWQALQKVADASLCAIFFDEYDVLQVMTKEEITAMTPVSDPEAKALMDMTGRIIPECDYVLRGQFDSVKSSPYDTDPAYDPEALPNIGEFRKIYDVEANKVKITYRPRSIKKGGVPGFEEPLTDIVWKPDDDVVVRATRLIWPLPSKSVYSSPDNNSMYFFISPGEVSKLWPYKGKANINGEIVEWEGKEYFWREPVISKSTGYPITVDRWEILYSEAERIQRDAKSKSAVTPVVNGFTGKMRLKVDDKKRLVTGRAADLSKYQVDHNTGMRPGWNHVRTVLGDVGVNAGWWPGEQGSSFYPVSNTASETSLEINRPTNRNDDWFKTQALFRRDSSMAKPLQQWGFRFRFKESATMGEISLMFNMGAGLGGNFGSQVVNTLVPATFNQMYQISFLETQGIVRNVAHEIAAWVQSSDPLHRTHDNAIRGGASRMYTRNYADPWEERMKGYRWEFKRNVWYDVKVDLTRGRGYSPNHDMHFFVWINGVPAGGFAAAGPPNQHLFLPPTDCWAIGSRAASKVEIENAYSWTEFAEVKQEEENTRFDLTTRSYASAFLDEGILNPARGSNYPYRDGSQMAGNFFFDDFGSMVHEIREFDEELDKAPVEGISHFISNDNVRLLDIQYSPNKAKFAIVNASNSDQIVQGEQNIGQNNNITQQMILYGYVLTEGEDSIVERSNERSIRDRGEVRLDLNAEWINTKAQCEDLADWIVDHFSEPMDVVEVNVFGDSSYSIGDKVRVFYDKASINEDWLYIITKINFEYSENGLVSNITIRRIRNNETNGVITP